MKTNMVTLSVKDASDMQAYVAIPSGDGPFPAIIVFQEAFGVNHHIRNVAERIAKEGYIVIAPELFHRTAPAGFEAQYTDFPSVQPHMQAMTTEGIEADTLAAFDWLLGQRNVQQNKIGVIGFCMGGRASFIANTFLNIQVAVSFYGGGIQNMLDRVDKMAAPHLFFWGGKDQHIKPEDRNKVLEALRDAKKDFVNVELSYADHGFFCDERAAYNADAATEVWALVKEFFKTKFCC